MGALEAGELNGKPVTRKGLAEEFTLTKSPKAATLGTSYTQQLLQ